MRPVLALGNTQSVVNSAINLLGTIPPAHHAGAGPESLNHLNHSCGARLAANPFILCNCYPSCGNEVIQELITHYDDFFARTEPKSSMASNKCEWYCRMQLHIRG